MTDSRRLWSNGRVAHENLRGQVEGVEFAYGRRAEVAVPVVDLLRSPDGPRDRQLLYGQEVLVLEDHDGWSFTIAFPLNYVGYVKSNALADNHWPTHWVTARSTHLYSRPDFKSPERHMLTFGAALAVAGSSDRFYATPGGYVPKTHIKETVSTFKDPVKVAELHLGSPYLWGGDSVLGIDCSGLIQIACRACGIPCPGDSDMQEAELGHHLPDDAPLKRGDLLFWKGHVAWVVDPDTLLHANAFHMATAYEPLQDAITRIERQGDGPVTARKRLGEIT